MKKIFILSSSYGKAYKTLKDIEKSYNEVVSNFNSMSDLNEVLIRRLNKIKNIVNDYRFIYNYNNDIDLMDALVKISDIIDGKDK